MTQFALATEGEAVTASEAGMPSVDAELVEPDRGSDSMGLER